MRENRDIYPHQRHRWHWLAVVLVFAAFVAIAFIAYRGTATSVSVQGEQAIRQAVLDSAKQCAAIEGAYPSSLSYLEEKYGLSVNRKDYVITYEVFASNIMPEVTVTAR